MTDERAMEILDPDHREHYESIEPINEACRIGIAAIKRTKELEAENAELKARLEKTVELPCKLGDTIYKVYDKCDGHNCPYNGCSGQWRCHYEGERRCEPFIKIEQFDYCDIPFVNDTVFVSREAAEARLKELKEDI